MDERITLLEQILAYDNALYDLQLFISLHPFSKNALRDYIIATNQLENLKRRFQTKYGALTGRYLPDKKYWRWIKHPSPWIS